MYTKWFTSNRIYEGAYLVYIAGIEVPAQKVHVTMGVGGKEPTASIDLIPDPLLERLGAEDRLEVQVFYLDSTYPTVDNAYGSPKFCLLFEGEILGWSYTNSPRGRALSVTCGNFLRIFNSLTPIYLTGPDSAEMNFATPGNDGNPATPIDPLTFPWNILFFGVDPNAPVETDQSGNSVNPLKPKTTLMRRPYDLISNMLEMCIGEDAQKRAGSVVTTNFYARYIRRTGLLNRFIPSPIIETSNIMGKDAVKGVFPILRAVRDDAVVGQLAKQASQIGMNGPLWGAIQQIFLQMYYETLTFTNSPIAQVDRTVGSSTNGEVLGPPGFLLPVEPIGAEVQKYEAEIQKKVKEADATALKKIAIASEVFRNVSGIDMTAEQYDQMVGQMRAAAEADARVNSPQRPASYTRPNSIINYVTKPQWLFGIAPTCNIVFPSMIQELRFEENYDQQPTRLYLNDLSYNEMLGSNSETLLALSALRAGYPDQVQKELDRRYGLTSAGSNFDPTISARNFLVWPEEFFRGPKSSSIRLPRWFTLLAEYVQNNQSSATRNQQAALDEINKIKETVTDKTERENQIKAVIAKIPEAKIDPKATDAEKALATLRATLSAQQETDNSVIKVIRQAYVKYEYFRQRAQMRFGTVVMTFNPYIVPGFPAIVFDALNSGQHFVGYVAEVNHEMSKSDWTTVVNFVHVQTLDEFVYEVFRSRTGDTPEGILADAYAGPPNPIPDLRDVTQTLTQAEEYFSKVFHQNSNPRGIKRAAFDFTKAILFRTSSNIGTVDYSFDDLMNSDKVKKAIAIINKEVEEASKAIDKEIADYRKFLTNTLVSGSPAEIDNQVEVVRQQLWSKYNEEIYAKRRAAGQSADLADVLSKYTEIVPTTAFAPMFANYANAMKFISRPICTLDEYVSFRGPRGTKVGRVDIFDERQGRGGVYYERILKLKAGPGTPPVIDNNNNIVSPPVSELPDTRTNWVPILKAYREKTIAKRLGLQSDTPEVKP